MSLYINHLTLSLLAVTAALFVGSHFVLVGEAREERRGGYALAFGAAGLVMAVTGFHTALTWPLPAQFNIAYGEPLAWFGVLLVAGGAAIRRGIALGPLAGLGAAGGVSLLLVAYTIARYQLTLIPGTAAVALAATGLAALVAPARRRNDGARFAVAALLAVAGATFAIITARACLHHLHPGSFDRWVPAPERGDDARS